MFATLRKNVPRNVVQSNIGTITSPFSIPHSWATFTSDDCSTTVTMSWRQSTFVLLYSRFTRPKHQLQLNLVWPVNRNDSVMFLWCPVSTRHMRYHIMHELFFCPLKLSACRWISHSPFVVVEEVVQHRHHSVGPFPGVDTLVQQEVHLSRESFACNTEQTTLPGTLEVDWPKLQWIRRVVDLLCEIKAVVAFPSKTACSMTTKCEVVGKFIFCNFAHLGVARPLHHRPPQMIFVVTNSNTLLGI